VPRAQRVVHLHSGDDRRRRHTSVHCLRPPQRCRRRRPCRLSSVAWHGAVERQTRTMNRRLDWPPGSASTTSKDWHTHQQQSSCISLLVVSHMPALSIAKQTRSLQVQLHVTMKSHMSALSIAKQTRSLQVQLHVTIKMKSLLLELSDVSEVVARWCQSAYRWQVCYVHNSISGWRQRQQTPPTTVS